MTPVSDSAAPKPNRVWRIARRLLRIFVAGYIALCAIAYFAQDWLAFPGMTSQNKPETQIQFGGDAQTVFFKTSNGISIASVLGLARRADGTVYSALDHRPTILYFYGNAGSVAWSQGEFDHFRRLDCNVLIPDLAGFGASGGKPSEANFYATADAAWTYLQTRQDIDPRKIIVVGWSMGAGVAIDLASRKPLIGLATFNAFTSLPDMAHKLLPFLPTGPLLKYRFDNQAKIGSIHCPTLICNGSQDVLVPPEMSDRLAKKAGGPVTRLVIAGADHNSIFSAEPDKVWQAMQVFVDRVNATASK